MKTRVIGRQLFDDIGTNKHLSWVGVTLRGLIVALATHWRGGVTRERHLQLPDTSMALTKNACAGGVDRKRIFLYLEPEKCTCPVLTPPRQ